MVYFGGFFAKLEFSRGFHYIYIIINVVWISEAEMGGAGDNILINRRRKKIGRRYGLKNGSKKEE